MDIDGNGYLTRAEMLSPFCLKVMGLTERDTAAIELIFNQMDINEDGKVTLDEFFNICKNMPPEIVRLSAIRRSFQKIDMNLDGKITEEELFLFLKETGTEVTPGDVHSIFLKLDKDGDGKLSPREFVDLF